MLTDGIIKLILGYVGIQELKITSERPDTVIHIEFMQYGIKEAKDLTIQEIIDCLCKGNPKSANGSTSDDLNAGGGQ